MINISEVRKTRGELRRLATAHPELIDTSADPGELAQAWIGTLRCLELKTMNRVAFSINESAELLGVSRSTILRSIEGGKLRAAKVAARTYRISAVELQRYWRECGGGDLWPEGWPGITLDDMEDSE